MFSESAKTHSRTSVAFYLFLVFASGILVGFVSHRLYVTNTASASTRPETSEEWRKRYLVTMKEKVAVNDSQITVVDKLIVDARRKMDALRAQEKPVHDKIQQDLIEDIRSGLTDQQRAAYDKWHAERERAKLQDSNRRRN